MGAAEWLPEQPSFHQEVGVTLYKLRITPVDQDRIPQVHWRSFNSEKDVSHQIHISLHGPEIISSRAGVTLPFAR
ncbi:hypothetical protein GCM10009076_14240 [Erythrobacter ramosus]